MKTRKTLVQLHDRLFRRTLQQKEIARELFSSDLPPTLLDKIDLSTLSSVLADFVVGGLGRLQNDCIYRADLKDKSDEIFIIVEHQSTADPRMAARLLTYQLAVMNYSLQQGRKGYPLIWAYVIYHGTSPYPYSTAIWDCFTSAALAKKWMFSSKFTLVDLHKISDKALLKHPLSAGMKMALKHNRVPIILDWLPKLKASKIFDILRKEVGSEYISDLATYILDACGDDQDPENLKKTEECLDEVLSEEEKENVMTLAKQLEHRGLKRGMERGLQRGLERGIKQGLERGVQQGLEQGAQTTARKLLAAGLARPLIMDCTGLSGEALDRLEG